jgi:cytochrome b561
MGLRNTTTRYGLIAKWLHWIIFLLLFCQVTGGYFLDFIPKEIRPVVYNIHKLIGITILVLMICRAIWALTNPKPLLPLSTRLWEQLVERLIHFFLYLAVMAMALAGWIGAVAGGKPPHVGDLWLSLPIPVDKVIAKTAFSFHSTIAIILIILVSIHAAAALFHYFIKKDHVLQRMMSEH